jgi:hypothetical protein
LFDGLPSVDPGKRAGANRGPANTGRRLATAPLLANKEGGWLAIAKLWLPSRQRPLLLPSGSHRLRLPSLYPLSIMEFAGKGWLRNRAPTIRHWRMHLLLLQQRFASPLVCQGPRMANRQQVDPPGERDVFLSNDNWSLANCCAANEAGPRRPLLRLCASDRYLRRAGGLPLAVQRWTAALQRSSGVCCAANHTLT